jgi:hypothetical protein
LKTQLGPGPARTLADVVRDSSARDVIAKSNPQIVVHSSSLSNTAVTVGSPSASAARLESSSLSDTNSSSAKEMAPKLSKSASITPQRGVDAVSITENSGFIQPRRKKKEKMIKGKAQAGSGLLGAPEPIRHVFVYRAAKDTTVDVVKKHLRLHKIEVVNIDCISHNEAIHKSFKVTVKLTDYKLILREVYGPWVYALEDFTIPHQNDSQSLNHNPKFTGSL